MDPELWRSLGFASLVTPSERRLAEQQRRKRAGESGPSRDTMMRNRKARKAKRSAKKRAAY